MERIYLWLVLLAVTYYSCNNQSNKQERETTMETSDFVGQTFSVANKHLSNAIEQNQDLTKFPRSTDPDGTLHTTPARGWTSGFFPGSLWLMYKYSNEEKFKNAAIKWTGALSEMQHNTGTHDVGFIINCSYGNGIKLTNNEDYKPVMIQAAKSLCTRYNENVGCTKSWDWSKEWQFPVIVDNMMNLELLFEASKISGDSTFWKIAIDHANTTMENHYREDNSSVHVVDYDPETGDVKVKVTHQGYSDESAWARGQAWGLYGFVICYRETKDQKYLDQANKVAEFVINHPNTPEDFIPYWDYDTPDIPDTPRDASAAAIIASALLELSTYVDNQSARYFSHAENILKNLSSDEYLASPGTNNNFLLKHCTGNKPGDSEIDVPLVYGDYYFLEAILRYKELNN